MILGTNVLRRLETFPKLFQQETGRENSKDFAISDNSHVHRFLTEDSCPSHRGRCKFKRGKTLRIGEFVTEQMYKEISANEQKEISANKRKAKQHTPRYHPKKNTRKVAASQHQFKTKRILLNRLKSTRSTPTIIPLRSRKPRGPRRSPRIKYPVDRLQYVGLGVQAAKSQEFEHRPTW
jgi:hypothetical protein